MIPYMALFYVLQESSWLCSGSSSGMPVPLLMALPPCWGSRSWGREIPTIAGAFNRWAQQDLDMLGGTDGHVFECLLNDYFFCQEDPHCSHFHPTDFDDGKFNICKFNNNIKQFINSKLNSNVRTFNTLLRFSI